MGRFDKWKPFADKCKAFVQRLWQGGESGEEEPGEKKKITLQTIGLPRLIIILLCGIFLLVLSMPGASMSNKEETGRNSGTGKIKGKKVSTGNSTVKTEEDIIYSSDTYVDVMEKKVGNMLQKISGVGDVEVMITLSESAERVPLKDSPYSSEKTEETDSVGGARKSESRNQEEKTILIEGSEGEGVPYIIKENLPQVEGVLVIAEGSGNETVKSQIIESIQVLFNVSAHKIKVMKMK